MRKPTSPFIHHIYISLRYIVYRARVGFPFSISSKVTIDHERLPLSLDPTDRLLHALQNETVDGLQQDGNCLSFRRRKGIHVASVPRPGGQLWLFEAFDAGRFEISRDPSFLTVRYELSTRTFFWLVTGLVFAIAALIYWNTRLDHQWGLLIPCGVWLDVFASQYVSKSIEIKRWLKKIMTSESLPPSAELQLDEPA